MVLGVVVAIGSRLAPLLIRTGARFGAKSYLRSPVMGSKGLRLRYGKLSPLAKRSVESLLGGFVSGQLTSFIKYDKPKSLYTKRLNNKLMPYGYGRRTYGRRSYSRYPRYSRYSRPYRRRSYRRY